MINKPNKNEVRQKRHLRIRSRIQGSASRPRLSVYRSTSGIYAQIIDDETGCTLVSCSTIAKGMDYSSMNKTEAAAAVGEAIAKRALEKGIDTVVFDRGGYLYTGRVKALADGARSGGLKF